MARGVRPGLDDGGRPDITGSWTAVIHETWPMTRENRANVCASVCGGALPGSGLVLLDPCVLVIYQVDSDALVTG